MADVCDVVEVLRLEQWVAAAAQYGAPADEARERFYAWLREPLTAPSADDVLLRMVSA